MKIEIKLTKLIQASEIFLHKKQNLKKKKVVTLLCLEEQGAECRFFLMKKYLMCFSKGDSKSTVQTLYHTPYNSKDRWISHQIFGEQF